MSSIIFHQVDFSYDSPYSEVFRGLSLLIDSQWKTALTGRNGRGKTTLLRLLNGELNADGGSIEIAVQVAFFPYQPPDYSLSTFDVIKDAVAPFRKWQARMNILSDTSDESSVREFAEIQELFQEHGGYEIDSRISKEAELIGIDSNLLARRFNSLSGGEQTRALIAAMFLKSDRYPLIDEPTNQEGEKLSSMICHCRLVVLTGSRWLEAMDQAKPACSIRSAATLNRRTAPYGCRRMSVPADLTRTHSGRVAI
jgi:lincosamide and streptogramin A transport system ATP-binding/permease protein